MPEQLSLAGFERAPPPTDRLFLAVLPASPAAVRIADLTELLIQQHGLSSRPLPIQRLHTTLFYLGDYRGGVPEAVVGAAGVAAKAVVFRPFNVVFDRVGSFRSGASAKPLVLRGGDGLADLIAFRAALGMELNKTGLRRTTDEPFTPHVTLLYDPIVVADRIIDPIGWTVTEFVLVQSLLGQTRHIPLARWRLDGAT